MAISRSKATAQMMFAMMVFGSVGFIGAKTGLYSFELVFVRCICATLFLGAIWLGSGKFKEEQWDRRELATIIASGIFLVFNWIFLFKAFEQMSVTIAISIYYLAPIFVLLVGSFLFREKLMLASILSVVVCFIGTLLLMGVDGSTSFREFVSSGFIWAFLAAIFYATVTLISKGIHKMSPYAVTFIQTFLGMIILLPFVNLSAYSDLHLTNWVAILIIGFVHTGFVYYLFFNSVRYLPAKLISVLVFLDPGVAILLDTVITGFRPSFMQIFGIMLVFGGMALTLRNPKAEG